MSEHSEILRGAGLRVTQQRTTIVAVLAATADHPSADELFLKAREIDDSVSSATVYRTLSALEEAGLVRKLCFENAPARYEMMPQCDHDHLIDVETGDLVEIPSEEIVALLRRLAAERGYEIVSQHTILRGRRKPRE